MRLVVLVVGVLLLSASPASAQLGFSAPAGFAVGDGPNSAAVADVNADGDPDLLVANGLSSTVSVLLGASGGGFGAATGLAVGTGPGAVGVGLFNGDADPDLVTPNLTTDDVSVLLGGDGGSFGSATNFVVGDNPRSLALGDFDGDGRPDLAVTILNNVSVMLGLVDGSFADPTSFPAGNPRAVAVGHFNGDSDPDLALTDAFSDQLVLLMGASGGSFGSASFIPRAAGSDPSGIAVADLNGDGRDDLAVANFGSADVSVLLGQGDGSFGAATDYAVGTQPSGVAAGNLNGDALPDLAVANNGSDDVSVLLGRPDAPGGFAAAVQFPAGDGPEPPVTGDFDADGKPDLAVPDLFADGVSVLLNQTPFPAPPVTPTVSPPPPPPPPSPSPSLAAPQLGVTVNVREVSGSVRVALPAGAAAAGDGARAAQKGLRFVPLQEARQIPVGSFLDTKRGTVELVTATGVATNTQAGRFSAGVFQVLQSRKRSAKGLTALPLKGSSFTRCRARGAAAGGASAAQLSRRTIRRLRANAKGRFRTRGRHSAATVRGTVWITADRCDGTLTTVKRGKVAVRDFRRKRTITLRTGKSYLARARR